MAFQVSPGVLVTEKDLTNVIPAVSTTSGGKVIINSLATLVPAKTQDEKSG